MGTFLPTSVSPLLSTRFVNVLHWAAELHERQVKEAHNSPYISHLLSVAALTIEKGTVFLPGDLVEDAAIVALLHHAVDDIGLPLELFGQIGGTVQAAVAVLCDDGSVAKPRRKQHYLDRLANASGQAGAIAHLVAAADQLDQLRFYADQGRSLWGHEQSAFYQRFLERVEIPPAWNAEINQRLAGLQSGQHAIASNAAPPSPAATAALPSMPTGYCPV